MNRPRCGKLSMIGILIVGVMAGNADADLVAFYDFNDSSDPFVAVDVSGNGNDGEVIDAIYTSDQGGHTGQAGDRAMDFGDFDNGAYVDLVTAADGAFNSLMDTDMVTLSMWIFGNDQQPVDQWTFYAGPDRQLGSHIPWSNSNVYFDVAGTPDSPCCDDRINTPIDIETFAEEWNHYTFVKNEDETFIYQNGEYLIDGFDMRPLNEITEFFIGVGPEEDRRSYAGLIDDFGIWNNAFDDSEVMELFTNGPDLGGGGILGDFNNDGTLDHADVNLLSGEIAAGTNAAAFDLTNDSLVDQADLSRWVKAPEIKKTWFGDADLNGEFNSSDFVTVFQAGKFEQDVLALWQEGDWNADLRFSSSDFVVAFQDGGFEQGPVGAVNAVPEPSAFVLLLLGFAAFAKRRRAFPTCR